MSTVRLRARGLMAMMLALITTMALGLVSAPTSSADDITVSYDALRTGWDPNESGLAPTDVSSPDFGNLFAAQLDGQIYAQPVIANGIVIAATENNWVYGLDAKTGAIVWKRSVGAAWPASAIGCGDLTPNIGITATPVVDSMTGTAYFTAKVNDGATTATPHWYMHAIDVSTGAERAGFPHAIAGAPSNDPSHPFNPKTAMQRPGLVLTGGVVYAAFGSHCDYGPYVGYVVGVNASTGAQTAMWSTEAGSSSQQAGIWQSGGGLVSDGPGRIFLATGNGVSPAPGPGTSPPSQLAESVVRLQVGSTGTLSAKDFFSPANNTNLDRNDVDLGSGAPMAVPDGYGTAAHPHLMVQVGKDGRVFLLDRDNLGGVSQGAGGTDAVLQANGPYLGVWGHPAFWGGDGGWVYTVTNNGPMRAFQLGVNGSGIPSLSAAGVTTDDWGYSSGSPVVTSSGSTAGSALVWATYTTGPTGAGGELRAYDAVPVNGVLKLRYSYPIGTASKFAVAGTDGGRVYVGNRAGVLYGFGRPTSSPLSGSGTDFGFVATGTSATQTTTVTATTTVTVNSVAVGAPFAVVGTSKTLPTTLTTGQTLDVTLSATPITAGTASSTLVFTPSSGPVVPFDVRVFGSAPGLAALPTGLSFGQVPVGGSRTYSVNISNTDSAPTTITGVTAPSAPYTSTSLPGVGMVLQPGASVSVPITFTPTATTLTTDSLVVTAATGSVTVPLSGTGVVGAPKMTLSSTSLDFGSVLVGGYARKSFDVTNTGNLVLTITKAAPPTAPFNVLSPIAEGQQLQPGDTLHIGMTFVPTQAGTFTGSYLITSNDGAGAQAVAVRGVGYTTVPVPSPTAGGWKLNGSASQASGVTTLTPATTFKAGDVVYSTPVVGPGLHAKFTATIGGGTGADGMSFAILDASKTTSASLGKYGGALGWAPLPGVAVTLDTYKGAGDPSSNFVGIATGFTGTTNPVPTYAATANLPTSLRTGSHIVDVTATATSVRVTVDGGIPLTATVTVPRRALLAFTGGTGGLTDRHQVSAVTITQRPPTGPITGPGGKCVDVRGGSTTNATPVQIYGCNGSLAQLWSMRADYTVRALNKCLDVYGGGIVNGTRVELYNCNGTGAQTWIRQSTGVLYNPRSGKCLDDPHGSTVNGTQLQIWSCTYGINQRWIVPTQ